MSINYNNSDIVLSTSVQSIISVGSLSAATIMRATLVNNSASATHNVTVYRVPNGGAASSSNVISFNIISPDQTIPLLLSGQSLISGQSIWALVDSGSDVNINISIISQDH